MPPQPAHLKKILICSLVLLFLGLAFLLVFKLIAPSSSHSLFELEKSLSKKILDKISTMTDQRGFYGIGQSCTHSDLNDCYIQNKKENEFASFRENLAIIWARFKYFESTGDQSEYLKIKTDIDNLFTYIVGDDYWELQTKSFNCAFMSELVNSPLIEPEYQDKALRLCNEATFEYHPSSIVGYDQHHHPDYVFQENNFLEGQAYMDSILRHNYAKYVDNIKYTTKNESDFIEFQPDALALEIARKVPLLVSGEQLPIDNERFFYDEMFNFLLREGIAALDQAKALELNRERNSELAAANQLHFLLLLNETLDWYGSHDQSDWNPSSGCLLRSNLTYFAKLYPQHLSASQLQAVHAYLPATDPYKYSAYCAVSEYLVGLPDQAQFQYETSRQNSTPPDYTDVGFVYLGSDNDRERDDYFFDNEINAIFAGLFAKENL